MAALAPLLRALPVVALCLGALDSWLVRRELPWREPEAALFLQAVAIWGVFALLALVPACLTEGLLRRRARSREGEPVSAGLRPALVLLGWTLFPVVGHAVLDRYTGQGQDVSGLKQLGPWIELGLVVLAALALLVLAGRLTQRWSGGRRFATGAGLTGLALAVGLVLPLVGRDAGATGPAQERPNLLLLVWDTTRSDHVVPYGYDRETTPHLARLAERAEVFEDSRSATRFTFTSHLTMLTGVHPSNNGSRLLDSRYRRERAEHLAALLRGEGYRTGAFVGTDVLAGRTGIRFGFEVYDDRVDPPVCDTRAWKLVHDVQSVLAKLFPTLRNNGQPHWFQDFQRPASDVLANALEWIERDDPRPWFCFVNLYDVHWPYVPGEESHGRFVRDYDGPMDGYLFRSDGYERGYEPTAEDKRHLRDLYDAELWDLDREVDAFLGRLDLDAGNTGVLLTSDHGEAFGEADTWEHNDVLEPQLRVPFVVLHAGSDGPRGRRADPTSGVDVAPTLLGLAGLDVPPGMTGLDLARSTAGPDRLVLVEDRDHTDIADIRLALYEGSWKLVRRGVEERSYSLFDLTADPVGELDVAAEHPDVVERLSRALEELRATWGGDEDDRRVPEGMLLSDEALSALGYTE